MYYVLFVGTGKESQIESFIRTFVPEELYTDCFHPVRHLRKKIRGELRDRYERLTPGYVFVESDRIEDFCTEAAKIPLFLKILGRDEEGWSEGDGDYFQALTERETDWLRRLMGQGNKGSVNNGAENEKGGNEGTGNAGTRKCQMKFDKKSGSLGHTVELSQVGFDENNQVIILSGPLKDLQGQIKKINLHKRIAEVEMEFLGRKTVFHLGIELLGEMTES